VREAQTEIHVSGTRIAVVAVADVDRLKHVNDTPVIGGRCMPATARARCGGARWRNRRPPGGDEFGVL
jgi:hypothetical protein